MTWWRRYAARLAAALCRSADREGADRYPDGDGGDADGADDPPGGRPAEPDAEPSGAPAETRVNDRDTVAAAAVELALSFPVWVRRRKWTFTYVNDTTVRRQQSIDFQLPPPERFALPPVPGATLYVPLWIPAKVPLTKLDMRDEDGRPVSVLTKEENGRIAAEGLALALADHVASSSQAEHDLTAALTALVTLDPNDDADAAALALAATSPEIVKVLAADDDLSALVGDLTRGFMFMVPVAYEPGRDRVLKVSFDSPHLWYGDARKWRARRRGVLVAVGLIDKTQDFPEIEAGWSRSLHLQLTAPEDVELAAASLEAEQFDAELGRKLPPRRLRTVYDQPTADLNVAIRVRVPSVAEEPAVDSSSAQAIATDETTRRHLAACRGDLARLVVHLRPPVRGVFVAAWLISVLTTLLIWLARSRLVGLDGQTSAALLLALPALLAAYLARPGEHAFAARLLLGVRILALIVGICGLAVAALVAAGDIRQAPAVVAATPRPTRVTCAGPASTGLTGSGAVRPGPPGTRRPRGSLTCRVQPPATAAPPPPMATASAQAIVLVAGLVAGLATLVLTAGIARTTSADLRGRSRKDDGPDPLAPSP